MREKPKIFGIRLLQFVFHPLIVVCYAAIIVIECNVFPFIFVSQSLKELLILYFLTMTFAIPMFFIIALNRKNRIKTYSNFSTHDLNIVLIIATLSYVITYYMLLEINTPAIIRIIPMLAMTNIAIIGIINLKMKVDIYTLALSGLCTYFVFVASAYKSNLLTAITTTLLALGIVNYTFIEEGISNLKSSLVSCVAGIAITGISIFFYSMTK